MSVIIENIITGLCRVLPASSVSREAQVNAEEQGMRLDAIQWITRYDEPKVASIGDKLGVGLNYKFYPQVKVQGIVKDGWAERHGIFVGDLIKELNGKNIADFKDEASFKKELTNTSQKRLISFVPVV